MIWNNLTSWIDNWFINKKNLVIKLNKIEFSNNIYLSKLNINDVDY